MKPQYVELLDLLNQTLQTTSSIRAELVRNFQNKMGNDEDIQDINLNEILPGLAYNLDFYEPDEKWRMESPNYYGEERLEELIIPGLQKIEEHTECLQ